MEDEGVGKALPVPISSGMGKAMFVKVGMGEAVLVWTGLVVADPQHIFL